MLFKWNARNTKHGFIWGGGSPWYKPYWHVPPQRLGLGSLWSENGYRFCPFWSWIGYGVRGNYDCVSMCSSFQFLMNKKEHVICELQMDFKKCFCCNDDIISVLCKLVMLRVKTGVENDIFWSKIGSGFGESGSTSPPAPPPTKKQFPGVLFQDLRW